MDANGCGVEFPGVDHEVRHASSACKVILIKSLQQKTNAYYDRIWPEILWILTLNRARDARHDWQHSGLGVTYTLILLISVICFGEYRLCFVFVGLAVPPTTCLGLLVGGYVVKRFGWSQQGILKFIIASGVLALLPLFVTLFIKCDESHKVRSFIHH